jgi:uncharacterized Rossmann fold enzyme
MRHAALMSADATSSATICASRRGWKRHAMPIQELVVGLKDDIWEVRVGNHLLSDQPTQIAAVSVAQTIARAVAVLGVRTKIIVGDLDGNLIEYRTIEP